MNTTKTRKRLLGKPNVAFTDSTVFILDFQIYGLNETYEITI